MSEAALPFGKRLFIAVDQLVNVLLGGDPDETVSARSYRLRDRWPWSAMRRFLDGVFFWQVEHCRQAYEWECSRGDLPAEYRDGQCESRSHAEASSVSCSALVEAENLLDA